MFLPFKSGLLLGLSIIISIGTQNLFVIKQGLRNEYGYLSALVCFSCDLILIILGAAGISALICTFPLLKLTLLILGIIFLFYYGIKAIRHGFNQVEITVLLKQLQRNQANSINSAAKILFLSLSFSLLNPQAILDTMMIIGSSANHYPTHLKYLFVAGAITASFIWFLTITLIANFFGKKLMQVKFWQLLEWISGLTMLGFAVKFCWVLL